MIPVLWLSLNPDCLTRGTWDQSIVSDLLDGKLWPHGMQFEHYEPGVTDRGVADYYGDSGAVVVISARHHVHLVAEIRAILGMLPWALVILTGDEEGVFPWRELVAPNRRIWVQTPHPGIHDDVDYRLPNGYPPWFAEHLPERAPVKTLEWFFAGQNTHQRRNECVKALEADGRGLLLATEGFTQGYPPDEYADRMLKAKVAPSPSGPYTPDCFRLYEALEAGAVPIIDDRASKGLRGYWEFLFGEHPIPTLTKWSHFDGYMSLALKDWPAMPNKIGAWWMGQKRKMAHALVRDVHELARGHTIFVDSADDLITVLMPTSPIPSHPSTAIVEQTIASVRERLPRAEILLMMDGVPPELEHMRADYEEYQRQVIWKCHHEWSGVLPIRFDAHEHQARMTRAALERVATDFVLYVEHDTPLVGDIPFGQLVEAMYLSDGGVRVIRLHHEASVLEPHRHLMLDTEPQDVYGTPLMRTRQWSQRPHLAQTFFYRAMLETCFDMPDKAFIEDVMHGVVANGRWETYGLWMFAPEGDMKRSTHLDGRKG